MIPTTAVFDASVFARAFIDGDDGATAWVADASAYRLAVHVPELVFAEVANALVTHARVRGAAPDAVVARVKSLSLLPLRVERLVHLAPAATRVALAHGISAYDACYLALAAARDATLVTADRRLAAAATRADLLE